MRRRRGGGAAPAEACGVWLDTAELKRGRARPLTLGAAGRKQSLVLLPGSRDGTTSPRISWQSSILSFFSPQPGDGDKENRRPAAARGEPRVTILPSPQLGAAQGEPPGAGGDPWGRAGDKPRVSPAGTAPGGSRAGPCPGAGGTDPAPGAAPSRVCCSPQSPGPARPLRERGQEPAGPCRGTQGCRDGDRDRDHGDRGRATLRVTSRDMGHRDSPRAIPSYPRDRESHDRDRDRDTAHRDRDRVTLKATPRDRDRDSPSAPRVTPRPLSLSPSRDSPLRAIPSPPRTTPSPPRSSPSPTWTIPSPPQPPGPGSQPLFTQDSEGNRVIKHC